MKCIIKVVAIAGLSAMLTVHETKAQDIPGVGNVAGLGSRIIKAIDLKIQRLQNEKIWLQNAQKVLENAMSKLHLKEIGDWVQKQKDLYAGFYNELWKVKTYISHYHKIKDIADKQADLLRSYSKAWTLLKADKHFTSDELDFMGKVYSGILEQTVNNANQLLLVVKSFTTQMSDAARMKIIDEAAASVDQNYSDLLQFNGQNKLLSLKRSRDENELQATRLLYGL